MPDVEDTQRNQEDHQETQAIDQEDTAQIGRRGGGQRERLRLRRGNLGRNRGDSRGALGLRLWILLFIHERALFLSRIFAILTLALS